MRDRRWPHCVVLLGGWILDGMFRVLHIDAAGVLCYADVYGVFDVSRIVGAHKPDVLTINGFGFWFDASQRHPTGLHAHPINRVATELLVAVSHFTATAVPLLHGDVVIASQDHCANIAGLREDQFDQLSRSQLGWRDRYALNRHAAVDRRRRRRAQHRLALSRSSSGPWEQRGMF